MNPDQEPSSVPHLSPTAMVALTLALGLPLTFSYAALYLGGDTTTWVHKLQSLIPIAGVVASAAVAALFWERIQILRFVPIAYAVPLALSIVVDTAQPDPRTVIEGITAGLILGLGITFAVWIET